MQGNGITTDKRLKIYFEYRYLIDNVLSKYSPDKYDIEELYDTGIKGLLNSIDQYTEQIEHNDNEFKTYASFCIKYEINATINNMNS